MSLRELEALLRERQRRLRSGPKRSTVRPAHSMVMPVTGVSWDELRDSFGDARSGGRSHQGIDIFAQRWTEIVATTSGMLTAVHSGERSGRSLWLVGGDGRAYFYAHLQAWADGVFDGKRVAPGDLIGYVGNSGNASRSPTHLHFEIRDNGRVLNPYPILARAEPIEPSVMVARRRERSERSRDGGVGGY